MSLALKPSSIRRSTRWSCFGNSPLVSSERSLSRKTFSRAASTSSSVGILPRWMRTLVKRSILRIWNNSRPGPAKSPARSARAAGAPDAVDVIFHVVRQIVVEHHLHVVHVNAARGDVRGHEKFQAGLAELVHHAIAHRLRHVAVQPVGHDNPAFRDGPPDRPPCAWCCKK